MNLFCEWDFDDDADAMTLNIRSDDPKHGDKIVAWVESTPETRYKPVFFAVADELEPLETALVQAFKTRNLFDFTLPVVM